MHYLELKSLILVVQEEPLKLSIRALEPMSVFWHCSFYQRSVRLMVNGRLAINESLVAIVCTTIQ
jgi:hypothetical protein